MFCSNCGTSSEANVQFCNNCGSTLQAATPPPDQPMQPGQPMYPGQPPMPPGPMYQHPAYPPQPYAPPMSGLPGANILLVAGVGNIIVGAVFIIFGLIEMGNRGVEFGTFFWVIIGGIIVGDGVQTIMRRNIFEKIAEVRTAMIVGIVVLSIGLVYFLATRTLGLFFILIIIPDILGLIGAQQNHNHAQQVKRGNPHNPHQPPM